MQTGTAKQTTIRKTATDLTGKKFGKLEVLSFSHYHKGKYAYWNCKCECGNEKVVYQQNLISGSTSTCGCGRKSCGEKYGKENLHIFEGIQIEKAMAKSTNRNNTSGFRGVTIDKRVGKYRARIISQGVRTELGYFDHLADAIEARLTAEQKRDKIIEQYKSLKNSNVHSI